jgi:predicted outer membrane repeat protein
LIDSILRGWKLPKFYFVAVSDENFLVEDGQQRLAAIYDFFSDDLTLSSESAAHFGGAIYSNLPRKAADSFDDFEIEYDIIEDATDEELKEFFLRLQEGMSLTSSEKLNAVHSKLRDFCRKTAEHKFFTEVIAVPNTRYAHFDIMAKVAAIEVEGIATGLRLEDVKQVFVSHNTSAGHRRSQNEFVRLLIFCTPLLRTRALRFARAQLCNRSSLSPARSLQRGGQAGWRHSFKIS